MYFNKNKKINVNLEEFIFILNKTGIMPNRFFTNNDMIKLKCNDKNGVDFQKTYDSGIKNIDFYELNISSFKLMYYFLDDEICFLITNYEDLVYKNFFKYSKDAENKLFAEFINIFNNIQDFPPKWLAKTSKKYSKTGFFDDNKNEYCEKSVITYVINKNEKDLYELKIKHNVNLSIKEHTYRFKFVGDDFFLISEWSNLFYNTSYGPYINQNFYNGFVNVNDSEYFELSEYLAISKLNVDINFVGRINVLSLQDSDGKGELLEIKILKEAIDELVYIYACNSFSVLFKTKNALFSTSFIENKDITLITKDIDILHVYNIAPFYDMFNRRYGIPYEVYTNIVNIPLLKIFGQYSLCPESVKKIGRENIIIEIEKAIEKSYI